MPLTFTHIQVFSELFHGSAREIIRSLECGLARAIARLKHYGLPMIYDATEIYSGASWPGSQACYQRMVH